jgi:hypothetical protein
MTDPSDHTSQQISEPPALPESYQKANRNYVAMSALLASWELIGIQLETKERWGIVLKSPSAVPLVLLVLVLYYAYKLKIEWLQCSPERRQNPAARLDYHVAHTIGIAAISILLVQLGIRNQIVNVISQHFPGILRLIGFMTFMDAVFAMDAYYKRRAGGRVKWGDRVLLVFILIFLIVIFPHSLRAAGLWPTLVTATICTFLGAWIIYKLQNLGISHRTKEE